MNMLSSSSTVVLVEGVIRQLLLLSLSQMNPDCSLATSLWGRVGVSWRPPSLSLCFCVCSSESSSADKRGSVPHQLVGGCDVQHSTVNLSPPPHACRVEELLSRRSETHPSY